MKDLGWADMGITGIGARIVYDSGGFLSVFTSVFGAKACCRPQTLRQPPLLCAHTLAAPGSLAAARAC